MKIIIKFISVNFKNYSIYLHAVKPFTPLRFPESLSASCNVVTQRDTNGKHETITVTSQVRCYITRCDVIFCFPFLWCNTNSVQLWYKIFFVLVNAPIIAQQPCRQHHLKHYHERKNGRLEIKKCLSQRRQLMILFNYMCAARIFFLTTAESNVIFLLLCIYYKMYNFFNTLVFLT